jgi:hypothetical protein
VIFSDALYSDYPTIPAFKSRLAATHWGIAANFILPVIGEKPLFHETLITFPICDEIGYAYDEINA